MTLPPYSGDGQPCRKCGYNLISTEYCPNNNAGTLLTGIDWPRYWGLPIETALIERKCQRCGYTFAEAPIDSEDRSE